VKGRFVNFAAWMPLFLIGLVLLVVGIWHLFTHPVPYMPKWAWAVLLIVTFPIGSVVYIAVIIYGAGVQREDAEGRTIE